MEHSRLAHKIFLDALEHNPDERASFLDQACADDPSLRKDIETLLVAHRVDKSLLETLTIDASARQMPGPHRDRNLQPKMAGSMISHYRVVEEIGRGGMGVVYRAQDTKLGREVALKIIADEHARDDDRLSRFEREARILASLNHPNIAQIYGLEETGGMPCIVMELVQGETLEQQLTSGPMPLEKVVKIARQIAEALESAHERGIVHRDLKLSNIGIAPGEMVKVLDFGLAKVFGDAGLDLSCLPTSGTVEGVIIGTPAYLSPEQARGQPVDKRTDIWAFGCILYEMLTGRRAFGRETLSDTIAAILTGEPHPLPEATPAAVRRLLVLCLQKDLKHRLGDIRDARNDLDGMSSIPERAERSASLPGRAKSLRRRKIASLAVLPLRNLSGDPQQDYFSDGMTEELIATLARIESLRVTSCTSVMKFKKTTKTIPEIAQELHVDGILEGSVFRVGDRVRITAQLVDAAFDTHLWADHYEQDLRDILKLQSDVARAIASQIRIRLTPGDRRRLAAEASMNPKAYEAYLKGRHHLGLRSAQAAKKALEHFEEAISIEPNYAQAYAGIADAYMDLGTGFIADQPATIARPKGKVAALKALEINNRLPEGHASLAAAHICYDWDWIAAEVEVKKAIELNPNFIWPHMWSSLLYLIKGNFREALEKAEYGRALDPVALYPNLLVGRIFFSMREYDRAIDQFKKTLDLDLNYVLARYWLGRSLQMKSAHQEAIQQMQLAANFSSRNPVMLAALAHTYAMAGSCEEAAGMLQELLELSKQQYIPSYNIAEIHLGLGETDVALELLQKAVEERTDLLIFLKVNPVWDAVRSDTRFREIIRRVGLQED